MTTHENGDQTVSETNWRPYEVAAVLIVGLIVGFVVGIWMPL